MKNFRARTARSIRNNQKTFAIRKTPRYLITLTYSQEWSNLEKMPLTFNYLVNELDIKEYYELLDILFEDEKEIVTSLIEQMNDQELLNYLKSI
ncbi:hypothetical protein [Chryseobacterium sp.]|uniref:hypothetical protein n=1 Tax=Chryseobacterium sp. TaxID=1871047 RepID=UPI00289F7B47|nr:hypothetical protein [Chryseobacterium sp.]